MKKLLFIISLFVTLEAVAQTDAESIYLLAWKRYNAESFTEAGELFEKSIKAGKTWPGVYLNAASSWAMAENNEKAFENLFKMIDAPGTLIKITFWRNFLNLTSITKARSGNG